MAKSQDAKKTAKKEPLKTAKEKKEDKRNKILDEIMGKFGIYEFGVTEILEMILMLLHRIEKLEKKND